MLWTTSLQILNFCIRIKQNRRGYGDPMVPVKPHDIVVWRPHGNDILGMAQAPLAHRRPNVNYALNTEFC